MLVQFAIPIFPPAQPAMFPVPFLPMAVQLPNDWDDEPSTTTTTTTTQRPNDQVAFAFPFPVPMPMPMPMPIPQPIIATTSPTVCQKPPPRPQNCPPCPPCVCKPSCTPSFFSFCSPCHQKCRCKRQEDSPRPLPPASGPSYAIQIGPPPVVVVPLPPGLPKRFPKKQKPRYSSCSADSSDTSSEEYDLRSRKSKKQRKLNLYRRSLTSYESENELVKPMLSYVARNGEIKFETKINSRDVAQLLGEKSNRAKTVHVVTRGDEENKREVVVLSKNEYKRNHRLKNKKVYLRGGIANHMLEDGKKELIFKPSGNKKISNLSLTFQIS